MNGPDAYFESLRRAWERAAAATDAERSHRLSIAGRTVLMSFAGPALEALVLPAFSQVEALGNVAGGAREHRHRREPHVMVFDTASTGIEPPAPPWAADDLAGAAESTIRLGDEVWASYSPDSGRLRAADRSRAEAVVYFPDPSGVAWNERAAPLRQVLHWLFEVPGLRMLHAAGVGRADRGVLLVGRSGAGKTTLALACLARGLDYLGDDYVAVETTGEPRAHSIYATAKPSADALGRVPAFERDVLVAAGAEAGSKAAVGLLERHRKRLPAQLSIVALVVPELIDDDGGKIESIPKSAAMLAMAPSTIIQHPSRGGEAMGELAELARRLPCFSVEVGPDPSAAAAAIERVISDR